MAKEMIAFCGLNCFDCITYKAYRSGEASARQKVADEWNTKHHWSLKADDIACDGCLPGNGCVFGYCADCAVRQCGIKNSFINCASCDDYPCGKLTSMSWFAERGKPNLDRIRGQIPENAR
jgi:hypothetical protein